MALSVEMGGEGANSRAHPESDTHPPPTSRARPAECELNKVFLRSPLTHRDTEEFNPEGANLNLAVKDFEPRLRLRAASRRERGGRPAPRAACRPLATALQATPRPRPGRPARSLCSPGPRGRGLTRVSPAPTTRLESVDLRTDPRPPGRNAVAAVADTSHCAAGRHRRWFAPGRSSLPSLLGSTG